MSAYCEFSHNKPIKRVTKVYRCAWCGQDIHKGDSAVKNAQVFEGEFQSFYLHPECSEALAESGPDLPPEGWAPWEQKRGKPYGYEE